MLDRDIPGRVEPAFLEEADGGGHAGDMSASGVAATLDPTSRAPPVVVTKW